MQLGKCLREFVSFLKKVDRKKRGEDVNPTFSCDGLNLSIVLIGRSEKIRRHGSGPYIRYIKKTVKEGTRVFYVLSAGTFNCWIADQVADRLHEDNVVRKTDGYSEEIEHNGRRLRTSCIRLESSASTYNPFKQYFETY